MTTTLFAGAKVRVSGGMAEWLLVDDGRILGTGTNDDRPQADRTVDVEGWLCPAFCDAHVHLPATGLFAEGLDFRGERSTDRIVDALAATAGAGASILFGGNFEEPLDRPLTRHELDRAVGDRKALVSRADMHSCVVSSGLLSELDISDLEGVDVDGSGVPTGYLREEAAATAWSAFDQSLTPEAQQQAVRGAVHLAYSKGIAEVHEMFVVEWRGWSSLELFLETIEPLALQVVTYAGTSEVKRVADLGLTRVGGDFFLDGSFGSHTAWMKEPFVSAPPEGSPAAGISYRSDDELIDFFRAAQDADMQTGVHAIGDAAVEQAITAWEKVAEEVGFDVVRGLGHRIEHFECASDDHLERAARLNLGASVQPAFDHYWGGATGLYSERIGPDRAVLMNRFKAMLDAGLVVGAGSDSTVTPLDPFLQMASLREHHVPEQRVDAATAFELHTRGGRLLADSQSTGGSLQQGGPADLVLLDRDPLEVSGEELRGTKVLGTWIGGLRVWPPAEAECE